MKYLIVGDSHVIRIRHVLQHDIKAEECFWPQEFEKKPDNYVESKCDWEHLLKGGGLKDNVYFSAHRGRNAWGVGRLLNEICPCIKESVVDKDTTILPFFGYIDAKIQLVKYKDPEEAVKRYVDVFLTEFPNNKIRFIEPIPQFINNIGTGPDIYNFEDRYPMHKEFIFYLRKECSERGLETPIQTGEMLGVDKFDESYECHECPYCLETPEIKWDHLKKEYNKIILNGIFKEMNIS